MTSDSAALDALFHPRAVAVIGASAYPHKLGGAVLRSLVSGNFMGPVLPVNPNRVSLSGVLCWRSVAQLPVVPDLAIVCTRPPSVPALIKELGQRGTRMAIVMTNTPEGGSDGRVDGRPSRFAQAILEAARPFGLRVIGPGSTGLQVPGIGLNSIATAPLAVPGQVALISQSGSLAAGVVEWARVRGIGFSHVIAAGDAVDVDVADLLDVVADAASCRAIVLYVRSITDGRKFLSAARGAARHKSVIVVKAGRHHGWSDPRGADATDAQQGPAVEATGVVVIPPDEAFATAIRRAGMLRVNTIDELFDAVETLASHHRVTGNRLAILSNGYGPAAIAADTVLEHGGRLAELNAETEKTLTALVGPTGGRLGRNVLDLGRGASPAQYAAATRALLADPGVNSLLVMYARTDLRPPEDTAAAVIQAAIGQERTVLACWLGDSGKEEVRRRLSAAGIPIYDTPDRAARGFLHLARYFRNQELLLQTPDPPPPSGPGRKRLATELVAQALARGERMLAPAETRRVLAAYDLSREDPIAPQETEAGDRDDNRKNSRATATPFPLLRIGVGIDPAFGPMIRFGTSASNRRRSDAEDYALALPPLNMHLAAELVLRTAVGRRLRGGEPGPTETERPLLSLLVNLSQLIIDIPQICIINIDPLIFVHGAAIVINATITLDPGPDISRRLAIRPYPEDYEETVTAADGTIIHLRPIRPEDTPAYERMLHQLTSGDMRMRFFGVFNALPRSQLTALIHIDYDRDMTIIAQRAPADAARAADASAEEILGVVNLVVSPRSRTGEYAVLVRSDQKGRGLGRILMEKIIRYAHSRDLDTVIGIVHKDNHSMLGLCRNLGFYVPAMIDDYYDGCLDAGLADEEEREAVVEVRLTLRTGSYASEQKD